MERREFAKDILLASIAAAVAPSLLAQAEEEATSSCLKIILNKESPQFDFFSIDSLGKNKLTENVILHDEEWAKNKHTAKQRNKKTIYSKEGPVWESKIAKKSFTITSKYQQNYTQPFLFNIEQHLNHATLLGMTGEGNDTISLPAILHLPDMGTLRVTSNIDHIKVKVTAKRFIEHPYVRLEFPVANANNKKVVYHFEVVSIHPEIKEIENDSRYDCFRKNFISIFQLNPFLKILANNTASDACAFTLFKYATVAAFTPRLAEGLEANDLIRMTLDRYLAGKKGYGLLGYDYDKEWDIPETATTCHSLDSYPSLLMSAAIYTLSSKNAAWFIANYKLIKRGRIECCQWIKTMMACWNFVYQATAVAGKAIKHSVLLIGGIQSALATKMLTPMRLHTMHWFSLKKLFANMVTMQMRIIIKQKQKS
ncbi:MAG: hypothetical protein WDN26_12345 [Chitinophagaceae bacterium]